MASLRFNLDSGSVEVALPERCIIGRARTNTISLPNDRFASKEHAEIKQVDGIFILEDLGSRNGTFIERGDSKVKVDGSQRLHNGDVISVGAVRFVFLAGARTNAQRRLEAPGPARELDPNATQLGALPIPRRQAPDETVIVPDPRTPPLSQ